MAGMEEVEVHSRSYLLRWIHVKSEHSFAYALQPHKKSVNFGIFRHIGHVGAITSTTSADHVLSPPLPSPNSDEFPKEASSKDAPTGLVERLAATGLKQVLWVGRCEPDKITQGKYEVASGEGGHFALVFDNGFAKSLSKNITVALLSYPTQHPPQFGLQVHHSQAGPSAMSTVMGSQPSTGSPKLKAIGKESRDSLKQAFGQPASVPEKLASMDHSATIFTGTLQKRRRKKNQGYARRFFSLDLTSSTLSYYHDRNSSALRGAIPLSLAAIGANAKTHEISIDSGAEIWHLRAGSIAIFEEWRMALEKASKLMAEAITPAHGLNIRTDAVTSESRDVVEGQDWARLESLLSRICGTRDAVRRLCLETDAKSVRPRSNAHDTEPPTPTESAGEDYFKQDDKRPFWKRKASGGPNVFKRSASAQLSIPSPSAEASNRNGGGRMPSPLRAASYASPSHRHGEANMHEHCQAMLHDLDSVVSEFAALIAESKQRRLPPPTTAVSRMSLQSVESQEFFDAEDRMFLSLPDDSDDERGCPRTAADDDEDSLNSSDIEERNTYIGANKAFRSGSLSSLLPPRAKSLVPLPLAGVPRRTTVAPPSIMPPSLTGFLRKNMGKDLSTISMPVSANEPTSLLQRAAEQLEYSVLLDQAAKATDAVERLIYVAAFAISPASNLRVRERAIRKPFNPMLGETYELVREDRGFRFVAEKVSHRPVQLAFHAEAPDWAFTQSPRPSQKFWGKSSEIITEGKARLVLHACGECFSWCAPAAFLRNVLAGEKYIEPVGDMTIVNETTGHTALVTFKSKGMFSGRSEEVEVHGFDSHGTMMPLGLHGTWTQALFLKEHGTLTKTAIWTAGPVVDQAAKHYGMTTFAASLNEITGIEQGTLPPTDSRLRPDQRAVEDGENDRAEHLKVLLEEKQRQRRTEMEERGEDWRARWFTRIEVGEEVVWKLKTGRDSYWDERAKGSWTGVVDVLKV